MITELERGFSGSCPYTTLADLFATVFDLWQEGKKQEAFDMFGRIQAFSSIVPTSSIDIMVARGVFKPGTATRLPQGAGGGGRGRGGRPPSVEQIRTALDVYLKPYLKA